MAATVARALSEYNAFAPYYDAFTAASDYEAWTRELLALAARDGSGGGKARGEDSTFFKLVRRDSD
jgi:hypothetical protein